MAYNYDNMTNMYLEALDAIRAKFAGELTDAQMEKMARIISYDGADGVSYPEDLHMDVYFQYKGQGYTNIEAAYKTVTGNGRLSVNWKRVAIVGAILLLILKR